MFCLQQVTLYGPNVHAEHVYMNMCIPQLSGESIMMWWSLLVAWTGDQDVEDVVVWLFGMVSCSEAKKCYEIIFYYKLQQ